MMDAQSLGSGRTGSASYKLALILPLFEGEWRFPMDNQVHIAPLTAEDRAIINGSNMDTVVSMLVGDSIDATTFTKGEWDRFYVALQCYELDYVY